MCGIAGIVGKEAARFAPALAAMGKTLRHRGPDARGEQFFSGCALGHTRLSIIDLETGNQPLSYNDGRLCVVFNGELYGYKALREQIDAPLASRSDTECIPALYSLYGIQCIQHLTGMFAFALWDEDRQRLFCARDRFGEKPFYYACGRDGSFVFASEIKAILASGLVEPALNYEALAAYMKLRYVPEGMTIYRTIHSLPPGHTLVCENETIQTARYWQIPPPMKQPPSLEEACEEFRFLMQHAVQQCLVADVDVGLLLSGGLDSTTIAALAHKKTQCRAYSFGYEGPRDERPFARTVAEAYGMHLTELTDNAMDLPVLLETLTALYDEPYADPAAPANYLLCRKVSQHTKVVLSGDGGDELLGGYDYWYAPLADQDDLPPAHKGWSQAAALHWKDISYFSDEQIQAMGLPAVIPPTIPHAQGTVDDALRMDLTGGFLPSDCLRKTDRSAMAHGLELRAPFLDTKLAEFLIALPAAYKIAKGEHKILLRRAFAPDWPAAIRTRNKQGFGTSVRDYLLKPEMQPIRHYYLHDKQRRIRSVLPDEEVDRYLTDVAHKEWHLLLFSLWLEKNPVTL